MRKTGAAGKRIRSCAILICLLLSVCACAQPSTDGGTEQRGAALGNELNYSYVLSKDGLLYYCGKDAVYSAAPDLAGRRVLLEGMASDLNLLPNGRLLYVRLDDGDSLWSMNLDGSDPKKLYDASVWCVNVVDAYIYFVEGSTGFGPVRRMNADGSGLKTLVKDTVTNVSVSGGYLYYLRDYGDALSGFCRQSLRSGKVERLSGSFALQLNVGDEWLYFLDVYDEPGVYRMPLDGGERERITPRAAYGLNLSNGVLYYNDFDSGTGVYAYDLAAGQERCLYEGQASECSIVDGYVYFCGEDSVLLRIPVGGGEAEALE